VDGSIHAGRGGPHSSRLTAAKRMGSTTVEADTSHVIMLSDPALVLDTIRAAARSV